MQFLLDVAGLGESMADFLAQQFTVTTAQAMNGHAHRPLAQTRWLLPEN